MSISIIIIIISRGCKLTSLRGGLQMKTDEVKILGDINPDRLKKSLEVKNQILNRDRQVEDIVKNHLEIIILSMLSERPMCGYDLIKEIFAKYNVFLSQGTVYPFLYSLKEEGILKAEFLKGDMRTKIYSVTQEGKQIIEKRVYEFIEVTEYFLNSIRKIGSYV